MPIRPQHRHGSVALSGVTLKDLWGFSKSPTPSFQQICPEAAKLRPGKAGRQETKRSRSWLSAALEHRTGRRTGRSTQRARPQTGCTLLKKVPDSKAPRLALLGQALENVLPKARGAWPLYQESLPWLWVSAHPRGPLKFSFRTKAGGGGGGCKATAFSQAFPNQTGLPSTLSSRER